MDGDTGVCFMRVVKNFNCRRDRQRNKQTNAEVHRPRENPSLWTSHTLSVWYQACSTRSCSSVFPWGRPNSTEVRAARFWRWGEPHTTVWMNHGATLPTTCLWPRSLVPHQELIKYIISFWKTLSKVRGLGELCLNKGVFWSAVPAPTAPYRTALRSQYIALDGAPAEWLNSKRFSTRSGRLGADASRDGDMNKTGQ